ncbi:hypothetical protein VQ03_00350 [Methylobacterium tarhaniae]|uniref:Rhodanese domain-containing protein n=1 Tax=Methylobacterium tarhaniae TaxID=1187852 RepID=A0A0J6TGB5_9HYPH|nr:rhodanese-like domain-containing protein [Methylobacterium tarhaniae]KMO44972.1 hypothetical protein VQ03_00350 [Methylobacterium tarhaniae]
MVNKVLQTLPAATSDAERFFRSNLSYETDCSDVWETLRSERDSFVLLDVRGQNSYLTAHVPGAVSLPHWDISPEALDRFPTDAVFVVYCAGPHCNGADKGAVKLAAMGRTVKKMIGGMTGWAAEGFATADGPEPREPAR